MSIDLSALLLHVAFDFSGTNLSKQGRQNVHTIRHK